MNTDCSQLFEGMVVKNYKEMCLLLKETANTGNAKICQIKRWKCFFDFKRNGQKFIITKIYEEPLVNTDERKNKNGTYIQYIEPLLLNLFINNKKMIVFTKKELFRELGMTNFQYLYNYPNQDFNEIRTSKYENRVITSLIHNTKQFTNIPIDYNDIAFFYSMTEQKLNSILNSSLKAMKTRKLIDYNTVFFLRFDNKECPADRVQTESIKKIFREVLEEMEAKNIQDIISKGKIKEFYREVNEIASANFKCQSVYSKLAIASFSKKPIINDNERRLYKKRLNKVVTDYFVKYILAQKEKYCGEWGIPDPMKNYIDEGKLDIIRRENFVDIQKCLLDYLIKIDDKKQTE